MTVYNEWKVVRAKTLEFLEQLPEEMLTWRPHEELGTYGMQIRHLGKIHEAYLIGMKTGRIVFSDKTFNPEIETTKRAALEYLERLEKDMIEVLSQLDEKTELVLVDHSGNEEKLSLRVALFYLTNHEVYHQGIFTVYARLSGVGKVAFL